MNALFDAKRTPMAAGGKSTLRRAGRFLRVAILVLFGFSGGILLFAPWPTVWSMALDRAYQYLPPGMEVAWDNIPQAGPNWLSMSGLSVRAPMLNKPLVLEKLTVRLAFTPLVTIIVGTGRDLKIKVYKNMRVDISGGLALGALPLKREIKGFVNIRGDILLDRQRMRPKSGVVDLSSESIDIPGVMEAGQLSASLELNQDSLEIPAFSCQTPVPVKGSGRVRLDYADLPDSFYEVRGQATIGTEVRSFERSGRLYQASENF